MKFASGFLAAFALLFLSCDSSNIDKSLIVGEWELVHMIRQGAAWHDSTYSTYPDTSFETRLKFTSGNKFFLTDNDTIIVSGSYHIKRKGNNPILTSITKYGDVFAEDKIKFKSKDTLIMTVANPATHPAIVNPFIRVYKRVD